MSSNKQSIIYAGVDVAKQTLEVSLMGQSHSLPNDKKGQGRLLRLLGKVPARAAEPGLTLQVVLEASGGYESALVEVLQEAGWRVSVVQPGRVRHFAKAKNQLAKSDRIDAEVLVAFGEAIQPPPTPAPSAAQRHLCVLVRRRAQLVETRTVELNRAAHYRDKTLRQQARQLLALLERQVAQCERAIRAQIAAEAELSQRTARLEQVAGVGPVVAATLQAEMPELGSLSDGAAAALAGLAPFNRDSGPRQGTRCIWGGRAPARRVLYLAALTSVRHDPILRRFYQRLCAAGKKPLLALTAVMRKLIVLLNRLLKNPHFRLSH
jgi:transposase